MSPIMDRSPTDYAVAGITAFFKAQEENMKTNVNDLGKEIVEEWNKNAKPPVIDEQVMEAMKLVIEWRRAHDLCIARSKCGPGCPYWQGRMFTCDKVSTEHVLETAADAFRLAIEEGRVG
jgi:hypothetical protein